MFKKALASTGILAVLAAFPATAQSANGSATASGDVRAVANMEEFTIAQVRSYLDVMAQLESHGYAIDGVEKTFLGRMKITARNRVHLRELVVSRSTGEIMSDTILTVFVDASTEGANGAEQEQAEQSGANVSVDVDAGIGVDIGVGGDDDDGDDDGGRSGGLSVGGGGGVGLSIGN